MENEEEPVPENEVEKSSRNTIETAENIVRTIVSDAQVIVSERAASDNRNTDETLVKSELHDEITVPQPDNKDGSVLDKMDAEVKVDTDDEERKKTSSMPKEGEGNEEDSQSWGSESRKKSLADERGSSRAKEDKQDDEESLEQKRLSQQEQESSLVQLDSDTLQQESDILPPSGDHVPKRTAQEEAGRSSIQEDRSGAMKEAEVSQLNADLSLLDDENVDKELEEMAKEEELLDLNSKQSGEIQENFSEDVLNQTEDETVDEVTINEFFQKSASNLDQSQPVDSKPKASKKKSSEKGTFSRLSQTETRAKYQRAEYPNGPYRARITDENKISRELRRVPPAHDYFGYIFSAQSQRPPNYYHQYTLPIYKQPLPRQHMCITGERVPEEKIHKEKTILHQALPLSSLKIRWRLSRVSTVYKLEDLYAYLTVFGPIDGVYAVSVNSALVVFSDVESARSAIMCPCLGFPWDPLIAEWVEPKMNNIGFYNKYHRVEEPAIHSKN
ncbi:uncharacterized protein LOC106074832 isoform X1 [Biomphalaria glabrata]|uniref:Uncharacterized protein LOC106074832 isoform X1 n=2 Tax=Biomphalaria glabrata TaxID=6526 RepID=A0A9W3AIA5_BIOGL|nr:uncharacterized protein LOC106074832 isoform X1 [Biomphalaria glabrata]